MIEKLKKIFNEEQFNPRILGIFINPFYFARKGLYKNISELAKNLNGRILDVGCGQKPYEKLFDYKEYIGIEIDTPENRKNKKADYFYDGKVIPFPNDSFDCVITTEVLEHVFYPNEFLKEINRVTKMGGFLLITVPFVWDEHEQPFDYARYTSFGLKHLLNISGFEIIEHRKSNNGIELIFQLLNSYIYKVIRNRNKNTFVNLLIMLLPMASINILGLILSLILPKNNDLYLDNIILAKKVKNV